MKRLFRKFANDDDGAVTVDWVVLTAAVVVIGFAVVTVIQTSTANGVSNMFTKVDEERG